MKSLFKKTFTLVFVLLFLVILSACSSDNTKREEFLKESRERFDTIASSFNNELKNIECYNEKCESVIYFNFNEIPDDLEFVIRSNTATFSRFKLDKLGVSNVSIYATYNDKIIFQCDGGGGVVKTCK